MKKRDTQKFNIALLEGADVPDSVLDAARAEMADNPPEKASSDPAISLNTGTAARGTAIAVNKKAIIIACACVAFAACLAVILAAVLIRPSFDTGDVTAFYTFTDLEERQITSVQQYNEENSTSYIGVEIDGVKSYAYTDGGETVLFVQKFLYGETEYTWFIAVNGNDTFDILMDYTDTYDVEEINGYTVYRGVADEIYAKFHADGSTYYLTGGTDQTEISIVLGIITG